MNTYESNKKNNRQSFFNWKILFIVSLSSIITAIYIDGFSAIFPFLQRDFNLTRAQLGLHSTLYYLVAASFAVYSGQIVDLKGSKWSLAFSGIIMGLLYIFHSIAPNFLTVLILAGLTGISVSFNMPSINKAIVEWFSEKERSTALGLQSIAVPIGGLLGAIMFPFFGNIIGWRKTMILPSIMAISYVIFHSRFYQEKKNPNNYTINYEKNNICFWQSMSQLIKNSGLIKISVFGFFLGMMSSSITSHFTLFLFLDYGLPEIVAGLGFAFVQLGSVFGRAIWGILCDRVWESDKRKTFLYTGILFWLTSTILSVGLKHLNPSVSILFFLAFLSGCFGNGWPGLFCAAVTETVKEKNIGIATGFSMLFVRSGLMVAPPIFGYLADTKGSYSLSWFLLGVIILITSFGQYLLTEKG